MENFNYSVNELKDEILSLIKKGEFDRSAELCCRSINYGEDLSSDWMIRKNVLTKIIKTLNNTKVFNDELYIRCDMIGGEIELSHWDRENSISISFLGVYTTGILLREFTDFERDTNLEI